MSSKFETDLYEETSENTMLQEIYFVQFRDESQSFQVHKRISILLKL